MEILNRCNLIICLIFQISIFHFRSQINGILILPTFGPLLLDPAALADPLGDQTLDGFLLAQLFLNGAFPKPFLPIAILKLLEAGGHDLLQLPYGLLQFMHFLDQALILVRLLPAPHFDAFKLVQDFHVVHFGFLVFPVKVDARLHFDIIALHFLAEVLVGRFADDQSLFELLVLLTHFLEFSLIVSAANGAVAGSGRLHAVARVFRHFGLFGEPGMGP